jgi:hypothetical protein
MRSVDIAERRSDELLLNVLPSRLCPVIFRQVPYQLAHVGERCKLHDLGNNDLTRQASRPIRMLTQRRLPFMSEKRAIPSTRARMPAG